MGGRLRRRVGQIVDLRFATGYEDVRGRSGENPWEGTIKTLPLAPMISSAGDEIASDFDEISPLKNTH